MPEQTDPKTEETDQQQELVVEQTEIGDFIDKEKGEVYLLLDFLSGRADRKIRDEKISVPAAQAPNASNVAQLVERSLIDEVCSVRWPPRTLDRKTQAETAAILLKARDRLSEIASPASGASIAFTTFVTSDMSHTLGGRGIDKNLEAHHAILSNARISYPQYYNLAKNFNYRRRLVGLALPFCLAITILSSFLVSYFDSCPPPDSNACAGFPKFIGIFQDQGLPILYGLVGAIAGVLRSVQIKIRDGLLMPRDRMHIVIQLWLGVVMGATIGLFDALLAGPQKFAPPALSFIAGLGVDSVFLWIEGIIKTIFGNKVGKDF